MSDLTKNKVIFVNYTSCKSTEDQIKVLNAYRLRVLNAPNDKVDVFIDFTGQLASVAFIKLATKFLLEIRNKVNHFIVVGISSRQLINIPSIVRITGVNMKIFNFRSEGLSYLKNI